MPKLADFSVHPGSGDTVNFKTYNDGSLMQMVFYPAGIGFTLLFLWIAELRFRYCKLRQKQQADTI
jgi:heme exporter protein C